MLDGIDHRQLAKLKDGLEDIDLFLKEIEDVLELLELETDPDKEFACRLRLIQLQQHIETISTGFVSPQLKHQRKLTS
ncbi:MAG: hypothetical protein LBV09_08070 [Deferribacteraceae bacterium]|jgi:DNA-binding transcriptional MerR regulator|nr:hypothetical protein [Deferribacteraceae bacterium]